MSERTLRRAVSEYTNKCMSIIDAVHCTSSQKHNIVNIHNSSSNSSNASTEHKCKIPNTVLQPHSLPDQSVLVDNDTVEMDCIDNDAISVNNISKEKTQPKTESFSAKLARWAVDEHIRLSSLQSLLKILRDENLTLPRDPLLNTPQDLHPENFGDGLFYYFGIENSISSLCNKDQIIIPNYSSINLAINVDGLPLSKSSSSSFWPILGLIKSIEQLSDKVFLIALFHGKEKPKDLDNFFNQFIQESIYLSENGIRVLNKVYTFKLSMLICDAPAKSYVLKIKNHSGYFSCTKCTVEGDMHNRTMCFLETDCAKRNNEDFRSQAQEEHHLGESPLLLLPNFDMINAVPLDYMHLVCLGIVKRLLCHKQFGWIHGRPPFKLNC